jgi:hypothetical protein
MYESIEGKFKYMERKIKKFSTALASKEARNFFNRVAIASQEIIEEHPQIKIRIVEKFYEEIFWKEICARSQYYCEEMDPSTHVILVPSTCDVHHGFLFP